MTISLLDVQQLSVVYPAMPQPIRAVREVSFRINRGKSLCLAGETGSGKSTVALALLGLLEWRKQVESGQIVFDSQNLNDLSGPTWRNIRGRRIGMVFQDARHSLNPILTIASHFKETLQAHQAFSKAAARMRTLELLKEVGLSVPEDIMDRYPSELSGGVCQRIAIALSICHSPSLLIADEPTSALDTHTQLQILELLSTMKQQRDMALLLISHDLRQISTIGDRLAVMYHGCIIESGRTGDVLASPGHPYTRGLLECVPDLNHSVRDRRLPAIAGAPPAAGKEPMGCAFAPRCSRAEGRCCLTRPEPVMLSESHWAACLRIGQE